ncbi:hypothetical protein [Hyphococcus luteus]|uniref:Uncharacterized protein n=1 Tax=Hyphococcus luteus TaxID=2058213 RepID=A0A2S7K0K2_9PROT|nr:hypothetical protein [Marinicaulis flavus]PQA86037.1 hypothetical protein CW354_16795 [Marinicaulis flavus]
MFIAKSGRVIAAVLALSCPIAVPAPAAAQKLLPGVENCPADLQTHLRAAKDFLVRYKKTLKNDFEIEGRKGQQRRAERQIERRVDKLSFVCKADKDCDTHTAVQGTIVGGNRVRICSALMTRDPFCEVVEMVAHEFGHNAHIPKARAGRHHRRGHSDPDQVYQFGYYARELCKEVYGTGFPVGGGAPRRTVGLIPPKDIELFPKKGFGGHGVHFSIGILDGSYVRYDMSRYRKRHSSMSDLRFIGLNDSASSLRVKRGRWEVCAKKDGGGRCAVVDSSVSNLGSLKLNNKISSIRYLGE